VTAFLFSDESIVRMQLHDLRGTSTPRFRRCHKNKMVLLAQLCKPFQCAFGRVAAILKVPKEPYCFLWSTYPEENVLVALWYFTMAVLESAMKHQAAKSEMPGSCRETVHRCLRNYRCVHGLSLLISARVHGMEGIYGMHDFEYETEVAKGSMPYRSSSKEDRHGQPGQES
jgi:hypothetical protein